MSICKQQPGESLDEFLQAIKTLSKDCNFKPATVEQHKNEYIFDSFISGLQSKSIRQRLLENNILDINTKFNQTWSLEVVQKSLDSYNFIYETYVNLITARQESDTTARPCWKCGNPSHPRSKCPAKDIECFKCGRKGHFSKVCRSKTYNQEISAVISTILAWLDGPSSNPLSKFVVPVYINKRKFHALINSGSTDNFIHQRFIDQLSLNVISCDIGVSMASISHVKSVSGYVITNVKFQEKMYDNVKLSVLDDFCVDVILGLNFKRTW